MDRLTERTAVGILVKENYEKESLKTLYSCYCEKPNSHYSNCEEGYCAMEKLADYEDAYEQGRLIKLPCKVGDKIYEVSYENREFVIKEHIVKEFIYRTYRFPRIEIYCENENGFLVCNNIGKLDECLFLTQAEAEAKLKELRGGEKEN